MSKFKSEVDYWLQQQFLCGGPRHTPNFILQQLRIAKARYKREHRALRRDISLNIADHVTTENCHRQLFAKPKRVIPPIINGVSKSSQPEMWRNHFKSVFKANDQPYDGDLFDDINLKLATSVQSKIYNHTFTINEVNGDMRSVNYYA